MNIANNNFIMTPIKKVVTNPKFAEFAKTTACAIAVETTLKAIGRPTLIYYDKNANQRSKKYAATKEFLYQIFCLGLYLSLIGILRNKAYKVIQKVLTKNNPEAQRKFNLYDTFQGKINNEKNKSNKKILEEEFSQLINNNKDYRMGKGAKELGSIISTVGILAFCAPLTSQSILHPVMDKIFPPKKD